MNIFHFVTTHVVGKARSITMNVVKVDGNSMSSTSKTFDVYATTPVVDIDKSFDGKLGMSKLNITGTLKVNDDNSVSTDTDLVWSV
jgi:hypothetical protein